MMTRRFYSQLPLFFFLSCACATAPSFHPPLAKTASLEESLLLCSDYHLPVPSPRPVALKPFVDCVQESTDLHPPIGKLAASVFRAELQEQYSRLEELDWNQQVASDWETAIRAILRQLWRGEAWLSPFSTQERKLVFKLFPLTARALKAEKTLEVPSTGKGLVLDRDLERLLAGWTALQQGPLEGGSVDRGTEALKTADELCQRLEKLRQTAQYLNDLWTDQQRGIFQAVDPSGRRERQYQARREQALTELEGLTKDVNDARSRGSFRVSLCDTRRESERKKSARIQ